MRTHHTLAINSFIIIAIIICMVILHEPLALLGMFFLLNMQEPVAMEHSLDLSDMVSAEPEESDADENDPGYDGSPHKPVGFHAKLK